MTHFRSVATACFGVVLYLLSALTGPALRAEDSKDKPNMVLILDSSGSMWGQIEGENKVVSVRNVISETVKATEGRIAMGLVSYGHRQSSGCSDIELILNPDTRKAGEFIKAVNSFKPKGSTPISEALKLAARAAQYKERAAHIVLIADGLDNCKADPCQTASELEQDGKDLTIHAIAFDAKNATKLTALKCIADNTGGTFASARSEAELAESVKASFDAVLAPRIPQLAAARISDGQSTAAQPEPRQAMPRSDPLTTGTVDQTQAAQPSEPGAGQQDSGNQAPPIAMRAPDSAGASNSGVPVTLAARTVEGGAIIRSGLVWWIYKNKKSKDGKYELVETFREGTPTANLPAGSYRIAAAYGKVNLIKDIDVQPGHAIQETFVLNAGGLRLNAVTLSGTTIPPNSVRYDLFADESESDQFGNRKVVLRDAKPGLVLRLNAGAYQVVSTYGDANAIVRADVTVEPGRLTDATINHSAGKITFKLVTQPGGEALADTQWNILTPGGDVVKESAGALPTHILAAGNYKVVAEHQGKNYSREFLIEPGEVKQIEVVIQ